MSKCGTVAVVTLAVPYEEFEEGLPTGDQPAGLRVRNARGLAILFNGAQR